MLGGGVYAVKVSAGSLSGLGARSEGTTGLRWFLSSFETNSHSIQRKRTQKMAKAGFAAVGQSYV
jgi:hypothetical protein